MSGRIVLAGRVGGSILLLAVGLSFGAEVSSPAVAAAQTDLGAGVS